jgi:hypothetical protein
MHTGRMERRTLVLLVVAGVSMTSALALEAQPPGARPAAATRQTSIAVSMKGATARAPLARQLQLLMDQLPRLPSPRLQTPQLRLEHPPLQLLPDHGYTCPIAAGPHCNSKAYPCLISGVSPCNNTACREFIAPAPSASPAAGPSSLSPRIQQQHAGCSTGNTDSRIPQQGIVIAPLPRGTNASRTPLGSQLQTTAP